MNRHTSTRVKRGTPNTADEQLFGRESELARLERDMRTASLIALVAPAGSGKTALMTELVRRIPSEATIIDLHGAITSVDVCRRFAAAVGLTAGADLSAEILRLLQKRRRKKRLYCFDAAESVQRAALVETIETWFAHNSSACAVVASRHRIGLSGEQILKLSPLSLEGGEGSPAFLLLRRHTLQFGVHLCDDDLAAAINIVEILEGNPLAIRIASERLRSLGSGDLLAQLTQSSFALTGGENALGIAVRETWQALGDMERTVLAAICVSPSDCSFETILQVTELNAAELGGVLQSLSDKCLVEWSPRHRMRRRFRAYSFLRDFIHSTQAETISRFTKMHASYFAHLASRLLAEIFEDGFEDAIVELQFEHENFQSALEWSDNRRDFVLVASTLAQLGRRFGPVSSQIADSHRILAIAREASAAGLIESRLYVQAMASFLDLGLIHDLRAVVDQYRAAEEVARIAGDSLLLAGIKESLAFCLGGLGRLDDARELAEQALALLDKHSSRELRGRILVLRSMLAWRQRLLADALVYAEESVRSLEHSRGREYRRASANLAWVNLELGNLVGIPTLVRQTVNLCKANNDNILCAYSLMIEGVAYQLSGNRDRAYECFNEAVTLARKLGASRYIATYLVHCALVELETGNLRSAELGLDEALPILRDGDNVTFPIALSARAHLHRRFSEEPLATMRIRELSEVLTHNDSMSAGLKEVLLALAQGEESATSLQPSGDRNPGVDEKLLRHVVRCTHQQVKRNRTIVLRCGLLTIDQAEAVDLRAMPKVMALAKFLLALRDADEGASASMPQIVEHLWQGERILAKSAANRVHVLLNRLRRLGLGEVLEATSEGWRIHPTATVTISDQP